MLDPYATWHALVQGIRAVSDGSVQHDNHGAFGWTLSSDRGERLAFGKGPVRGLNLTPFRAEEVGLLSLLRFLIRIAEYTMMHEPWQGIVATDSKSLLDTVFGKADSSTYHQAHSNLPVLDPLQADWDILVEICHALEKRPGLTFQHIKGHQDRKTQYSRLSLLAQLNVDADCLASDYQEEYGSARPQVLMTPRTRAHVLTTQGTVTSNYATSVRHLAGQKPLRQYIQARHQWSDHTMQSVNWKAHGTSLRRNMKRRTTLIKLVHGILPTNSSLHRKDPVRCLCPSCQRTPEDWTHVFRCPDLKRSRWRHSFLQDLQAFCISEQTRPELQELLLNTFRTWLHAPTLEGFQVEPAHYHDSLHRLIIQQSKLGWHQLLLGRFSCEWARIQDKQYWQHQDELQHSKMSGQSWQVKLIQRIWEKWFDLWKLRNQAQHGHDDKTRHEAEQRDISRTLADIYNNRHLYETSVQRLLLSTEVKHRQAPHWVNRNWIATNQRIFIDSMRKAQTMAIKGVWSIRTYFHSMSP